MSGDAQSKVADGSDLLSHFMKAPEVFKEEDMVDEIVDFLLAGT